MTANLIKWAWGAVVILALLMGLVLGGVLYNQCAFEQTQAGATK